MNNKRKTTINNLKSSNRGVALVSVLIALTVCLLVATVVLEITYTSLLSRKVNKYSNDNFYSSETALDDVETVLQNVAVYTMNQLKTESSTEFIESAASTLLASSNATSLDDTDAISQYLFSQLTEETKAVLGKQTEALDGTTTYEYDSSKFKITTVEKDITTSSSSKSTLTFSVELNYIDPDTNYETRIATDLVMNDVTHRTPASAYSIGSYSMFTGGGATFSGNDANNHYRSCYLQEGNAYIGMMVSEAPKAVDVNGCSLVFDGNRVIINGDVYVNNGALIFSGDSVTTDGTTTKTQVDIRGTIYINNDSVLIIGDGVDFMCEDIVLVNGDEQWSVFDTSKKTYINKAKDYYETVYPYDYASFSSENDTNKTSVLTTDDLKANGYLRILDDFYNKSTSGCIMGYSKSNGTYVLTDFTYDSEKNKYYWSYTNKKGEVQTFKGSINRDSYFMPEALATIYTYDGGTENVDAEMCNFLNMDVLYWLYKNGDGAIMSMNDGARDMRQLFTSSNTTTRGTITCSDGYKFKDVALSSDLSTTKYRNQYSAMTTYTSFNSLVSGKQVLGKTVAGLSLLIGSNGGSVLNGATAADNVVVMTTRWNNYSLTLSKGNFIGINISADKVGYESQGSGCTTSYSILSAHQEGDDLQGIIDAIKYLCFLKNGSENYTSANDRFGSGDEYEKFYSLFTFDSLYQGGLDAFFDTDSTSNSGGEITVNSSNMYNFITVENWQTN